MRRSILYLILHAVLWTFLFWALPVLLPSVPGRILDGGILTLVMVWYPLSCLAAGVLAGLTQRVSLPVRIAPLVLLALIGTPGIVITGVGHPAGIALPLVAYGSGVLLGRIIVERRPDRPNGESGGEN